MKKILAERHINFYTIDGIKIGKEIGLGGRINTVLQSAFFKIADIIPADKAKELMKAAAKKSYMKKGQAIVDMNYAAIDRGMEDLKKVEIPADWANAVDNSVADKAEGNGALVEYVNEILKPVNAYKGTSSLFQHLWIMLTVLLLTVLPLMKREVSQLMFPNGILKTVFSVTDVQSYVLTL